MSEDLALNEPWATAERQQVATHFGVWAFLATETLFFGAAFLFYVLSRLTHYPGFAAGAREADVLLGSINTAILLTSSLTMAVAERAVKEALVPLARAMLWATLALGVAFLVVKGFEYRSDLEKHLLPGSDFPIKATGAAQFWSFYWAITVVHACHLTIGLGIVGRLLVVPRERLALRWTTAEGSALYWHLVDVVWVFLYPLLYLVGR